MSENHNSPQADNQAATQYSEGHSFFQRLLKLDARFSARLVVEEKPGLLRGLFILLGHSCDSWYWLIFLSLLLFFGNVDVRARTLFWIFGLLGLAAFVLALKFIIRRPRPEGDWGQIYRVSDPHSFPSGHAARAAGLAVMISAAAAPLVLVGLCAWALGVGISRVALKLHYLSDVLVGWMIGIVCGLAAVKLFPLIEPWLLRLFP